jgi:hypothetical protein
MMLLEEDVAMFPKEAAGSFPRETSESWNAESEEGKRKRPDSGKPEAGFSFSGRDAGNGEDAGINLGVEVEEGGKVGRELGDASKVADPGGDALTDEGNLGRRRMAGRGLEALVVMAKASSRWRYSRVTAGQPRMMQPSHSMGKAVSASPVGGRMVPAGGTKNRHLSMQREMPAAVKMLMVSVATRSAMRPSTKRPVLSIKAETPPPPGGGATTGMVLDLDGESILNSEKSRLKANGVQEGPKGIIPLLKPSGHMGNEPLLAEERRGSAVGILELSQPGADETPGPR